MSTRQKGINALAAGLLCWGVNVALVLTAGMYGPLLVILGGLGIFAGSLLLVWGDSFRGMSLAQKIPSALIAFTVAVVPALMLMRWAEGFVRR